MTSLLIPLLLFASEPGGFADLVEHLRQAPEQRVAVFPELLSVDGDGRRRLAGDQPHAREVARRIHTRLRQALPETVEMVSRQDVETAVRMWSADDLNDPAKLSALAESLGGVGVVLVSGRMESPTDLQLELDLYTPAGHQFTARQGYPLTISDLAYAGRSFEVRRWQGNQLLPVGFSAKVNNTTTLGLGTGYEILQARCLEKDLEHPLRIEPLQFDLAFHVDGERRELVWIDGECYLPLETKESVVIYLRQNQAESILLGIYIDGVNTYGRVLEHPESTPVRRLWALSSAGAAEISGWRSADGEEEEPFVIERRAMRHDDDDRLGDREGMITVIAYTNGTDGIPDVPTRPLVMRSTELRFGGGEKREVEVERVTASRGLMLFALTVHYRSKHEINLLRNNRCSILQFPSQSAVRENHDNQRPTPTQ